MILKRILTVILFFTNILAFSQTTSLDALFELQAYPTGVIPGFRIEGGTGKSAGHLRLGLNWIRHGSNGVHQDERGLGFGFSLGYKRYFKEGHQGLSLGVKNDIWFNEIDWKDNIDTPNEIKGRTDLIVIQPTLELGYLFHLNEITVLTPSLAFGYEWNAWMDGEPTGDGAILLVGFTIGRRISQVSEGVK